MVHHWFLLDDIVAEILDAFVVVPPRKEVKLIVELGKCREVEIP
jgi:hypothetical protein